MRNLKAPFLALGLLASLCASALQPNDLISARRAGQVTMDPVGCELPALQTLTGTGLVSHTAACTFVPRTLASGAGLLWTNADGSGGNPSISITALDLTLATNTLNAARLPTSGVTAATYGSSTLIPILTVDATGRITNATTVTAPGAGSGSGDVVGPASSVDNTVARYDSTTGKLLQGSGVVIDDSNNLSGVGTWASGAATVTAASTTALVVGPNGTTNPVLQVDTATASQVTGLKVTGAVAGSTVDLGVISTQTNEGMGLTTKGTGSIAFRSGGSQRAAVSNSAFAMTPGASANAGTVRFSYTGAADTSLTTTAEAPAIYFDIGQTRQHATGNITLQRDMRLRCSTHSAVGASVITDAACLYIDGPPLAGTNVTFTNPATSLWIGSGFARLDGGVSIKEGSNTPMGTATCNGTTSVTVANTRVAANTRIFLTVQAVSGSSTTPGIAYVNARSAGTSFDIRCTAADTSTVAWVLVEPAP